MAIDRLGELRRIMNKNAAETFSPLTDSLEAISEALGIGPSVGLWLFGVCDPAMVASTNAIVTNNLINMPNGVFADTFWMQVIRNANAPGIAPQGEIRRISAFVAATQTFTTDPFSANVEANDLLCIFHESLLSVEILGVGTLTFSSATVPADAGRAALYPWENNNYFRGAMLMPTEGVCRFQPRLISAFTAVGGVFTLDPGSPFSQAPGLVDYVIVGGRGGVIGSLAPVSGIHVHANNLLQQQVFLIPAMLADVDTIYLDLVSLTQNANIYISHQIDGANFRVIETFNWTVGMDDGVYFRKVSIDASLQVLLQSTALEGIARNVPWKYFLRS